MTIQDPVFGKLEWKLRIGVWEGNLPFPEDSSLLLAVEPPAAKAPPSAGQRQGFARLKAAWDTDVRRQVARKIWDYWKEGVEQAGQFGSIPVDVDKADEMRSPDDLYRSLTPVTMTILPSSNDDRFLAVMRFEWDWDLMGVVVNFVGNEVRKVTNFGDDDNEWMAAE